MQGERGTCRRSLPTAGQAHRTGPRRAQSDLTEALALQRRCLTVDVRVMLHAARCFDTAASPGLG